MTALENDIMWFRHLLNLRQLLKTPVEQRDALLENLPEADRDMLKDKETLIQLVPPPLAEDDKSTYASLLHHYQPNGWERATILLALIPHIRPALLNSLIQNNGSFETGARRGEGHGGILPTGETVLYLLAGDDIALRFQLQLMFDEDHFFHKHHIIRLEESPKGEPELSGLLVLSKEILDIIIRGYVRPPKFGLDFPAKHITTEMDWDDLVLAPGTRRQVEEVKIWFRQRKRLMDEPGIRKRLSPGYKILFHGAPGTGKTLTAQLLGKYIGKDVFRVDLSNMVSKYIGETEKNLAKVFDKADHSDWILFFDEADALFGSRTKVGSSNDRYANQEVSYLLQRIEDHKGIVILASNIKSNIDEAFMRRFSSVVHFPFPKSEERQVLWQKAFPEKMTFSEGLDMRKIADKYEISGANITNIVAWCSLMALENENYVITEAMIREGMARELAKEGRTL